MITYNGILNNNNPFVVNKYINWLLQFPKYNIQKDRLSEIQGLKYQKSQNIKSWILLKYKKYWIKILEKNSDGKEIDQNS